jgi:molybdate transport system substrate-binding protein
VCAAASLTDVLPPIASAWNPREAVEFRFDASSRLARQIESGAPADVFMSADEEWMDDLDRRGLLEPNTRRPLLGNQLVVVVPAASTIEIRSLADLARPEIERLALAGESVPAGRYADAALRWAGVASAIAPRVTRGDSVRTALAWVASGNATAAIVYATDARVEPRVRVALVAPVASHPAIEYPVAVLRGGDTTRARSFVAFLSAPRARAMFEAAGFTMVAGTDR